MEPGAEVRRALLALGQHGPAPPAAEQSVHATFQVGPDGGGVQATYRTVWRCLAPGTDRLAFVFTAEAGDPPVEFAAVRGCEIGRRHVDPERGVHGAQLVLARSLELGETVVTEHAVRLEGPASPATHFEHAVSRRLRELLVLVQFDAARVPAELARYSEADGLLQQRPLQADKWGTAHVAKRGFGPGVLGISWTW